ncbi:HD-GYP domain-containing protein [Neobacillus citreus]|uniref:HD-GYP domain-containing protein n=2 Tax=Neobacillus citreus TaxID=2833578 RepID=A0A9J6MYW4_9BACI|nr:HD-GYP domain-containing protein [Neobacillus citreus]MCH6264990.1 HD-GYP domain-containing protein [Neobacillus citreus]
MQLRINDLLNKPVIFRYGFIIVMAINLFFHLLKIREQNLYIGFILAVVFLGIGYYRRSTLFLVTLTTLVVYSRFQLDLQSNTLLRFMILEVTYLIILYISVGFMKKSQKIKDDYLELISALSNALDSRDTYTSGHSHNVSDYAVKIAKQLRLSNEMIETVRIGGLLHDIGKIGVPESILLKPGKLTEKEFSFIKKHPIIGCEMIQHVKEFHEKGIIDIVLYHHERFDGKGYPKGLKGDEIPLTARIVAVADTFDAIISKRVYSPEVPLELALLEIEKNKGKQFDPDIADAFLSLFQRKKEDIMMKRNDHFPIGSILAKKQKGRFTSTL